METTDCTQQDNLVDLITVELQCLYDTKADSDECLNETLFSHVIVGGHLSTIQRVLGNLSSGDPDIVDWLIKSVAHRKKQGLHFPSERRRAWRWLWLFVSIIGYIVLSPIFYVVHSIVLSCMAECHTLPKRKHLVLFEALKSKNVELVKLFLHHGACLDERDPAGNNVYHYIAMLSIHSSDEAIECHNCLIQAISHWQFDTMCDVIVTQRNNGNLTPFELLTKRGSMRLFQIISQKTEIFGTTLLNVGHDHAFVSPLYKESREEGNELGNLMNTHHGEGDRGNLVRHWEGQHMMIVREFDLSVYESGDIHQSKLLKLVSLRAVENEDANEVIALRTTRFLMKWMKEKTRMYFKLSLASHLFHAVTLVLLVVYFIRHGYNDKQPLFYSFVDALVDVEIERVKELNVTDVGLLFSNDSGALMDLVCPFNNDTYGDMQVDMCELRALRNLSLRCDQTTEKEVRIAAGLMEQTEHLEHKYIDRYLVIVLTTISSAYIIFDFLYRLSALLQTFVRCAAPSLRILIEVPFPGSYVERQFLLWGFWFLLFSEVNHYAFEDPTAPETRSYVHGAYFNKGEYMNDMKVYEKQFDDYFHRKSYLVMACLTIRFLTVIHSLRLLPAMGFVVITTERLAKLFAYFIIVFLFVSMAFAGIFYFVMRDSSCPVQNMASFTTLTKSLFYTYVLLLGQGNFYYDVNTNAKVAFILYTILGILLLLNLVIAIMSTSADSLNTSPFRETLCMLEQWSEILGVEAMWQSLNFMLYGWYGGCRKVYRHLTSTFPTRHPLCIRVATRMDGTLNS